MLKKKLGKKVLALTSAAVMAVSASVTGMTALSMAASASEEVGKVLSTKARDCLGTFVRVRLHP